MAEKFCFILNDWLSQPPISPAWSSPRLRSLKRVRNALQRKFRCLRTPDNKIKFQSASNAYRTLSVTLYKSYVMRVQFKLRANPSGF